MSILYVANHLMFGCIGYMIHRKPLYVAIAQRKNENFANLIHG